MRDDAPEAPSSPGSQENSTATGRVNVTSPSHEKPLEWWCPCPRRTCTNPSAREAAQRDLLARPHKESRSEVTERQYLYR